MAPLLRFSNTTRLTLATPFAGLVCRLRRPVVCVFVAGALLCRLNGEPPPPSNAIQGKILDPSRSPIPGATVTAMADGRALSISSHAGQAGEFSLSLKPGSYRLSFSADGFRDSVRTVAVEDTISSPLEIILSVAPREDIVTVTETANYQVLASSSLKTSVPLRDVPQSVSIVTQDLIRDQGMQNMADVVRYVPGITMAQGEGHRDAPVIRGNAT